MQNNYSQRLEMQIPKENVYTGTGIVSNFDDEFDKLSKSYTIHEYNDVKGFIRKHENILPFIHELTPLINKYFPNHRKLIEFCKDPEFLDLDFIMIYVECNDYDKDRITLDKFEDEPLYMSKFSKKINGLVCVDLW
ncbi:MAG: hypothetical protein IJ258_02015 [Methanobrevibacter sp.]|uniref:hypothetical protein n=1 Tax=Methanobrevibacter sp. TaxID=66852 RepID=UPI0025DC15AD|nr:hypothetical protein [Methanobrevibacter sp.]MBQ8016860.1 hypothetical protein [Methanobrevibacter sp.]